MPAIEPNALKRLAALLIFAAAIPGSFLAERSASKQRHLLIFTLGNAFAAGIFLEAALIHLLPDAEEAFAASINTAFRPDDPGGYRGGERLGDAARFDRRGAADCPFRCPGRRSRCANDGAAGLLALNPPRVAA